MKILILLFLSLLELLLVILLLLLGQKGPHNVPANVLGDFLLFDHHHNPALLITIMIGLFLGNIQKLPIEVGPIDRETVTWASARHRNALVELDETVIIDYDG